MDALILTSFIIPAIIAFVLIALLIKERYNLLPKNSQIKNAKRITAKVSNDYLNVESKNYLDFSGGTMGI